MEATRSKPELSSLPWRCSQEPRRDSSKHKWKVNRSDNWVSAKSQSPKTNRFKVLNEKDNRIREPDIQREQHFTVLDPVNHLVDYPRVQVQGGGVVILSSESGLLCLYGRIMDKQMLICLQLNTSRPSVLQRRKLFEKIIVWLAFKPSEQRSVLAASLTPLLLLRTASLLAVRSGEWVGRSGICPVDKAASMTSSRALHHEQMHPGYHQFDSSALHACSVPYSVSVSLDGYFLFEPVQKNTTFIWIIY